MPRSVSRDPAPRDRGGSGKFPSKPRRTGRAAAAKRRSKAASKRKHAPAQRERAAGPSGNDSPTAKRGKAPDARKADAPRTRRLPASCLRFKKVPRGWTEPLVECFREAVLAKIKSMDISNYRLAERSRISASMVGLIVRRKNLPGLEVAGRICLVDNGTLADLLGKMLLDFRAAALR